MRTLITRIGLQTLIVVILSLIVGHWIDDAFVAVLCSGFVWAVTDTILYVNGYRDERIITP